MKNKLYIIGICILVLIFAFMFFKRDTEKNTTMLNSIEYVNEKTNIAFQYDSRLQNKSISENEIELSHSIEKENYGICNTMAGNTKVKNTVQDVYLGVKFLEKPIQEVISAEIKNNDSTNEIIGDKNVVVEWQGVEGCGVSVYFVPVDTKTAIIRYRDISAYEELRYKNNPAEVGLDVPFISQSESKIIIENVIKNLKIK